MYVLYVMYVTYFVQIKHIKQQVNGMWASGRMGEWVCVGGWGESQKKAIKKV